MTVIFGTGHRPEDCLYSGHQMIELAQDYFYESEYSVVISGMASGFDLALAQAAIWENIPVWAARPWRGHKPRKEEEKLYKYILDNAVKIVNVSAALEYPGPWVYQDRNIWMVDNAEEGVAFWSGKKKGGTYNCLKYAKSQQKAVTNLYPEMPEKVRL